MNTPDDGGPAFPEPWTNDGDRNATAPDGQLVPPQCTVHMRGMSLRDYFAAKALSALNYHNILEAAMTAEECDLAITNCAALAYRLADAMLEARRK